MQWVKKTVGVAGAVPGGSFGRVGSRGTAWQLWTVVAMVVAAEGAPGVSVVQVEYRQVMRWGYGYAGDEGGGVCTFEVDVNIVGPIEQ